MFYKAILVAFAFVTAASAAPLVPPTVTACTGTINPEEGCVAIPVVSAECTDFDGGLSFLNHEVTFVNVPLGFVCTFFEEFGCLSAGQNAHDNVVLLGGTWNMEDAPGMSGTQDFNDLSSSFTCSPV